MLQDWEEECGELYCERTYDIKVKDVQASNYSLYINNELYKSSTDGFFKIEQGELNQYFGSICFTIGISDDKGETIFFRTKKFECCFLKNANKQLFEAVSNMINYISENNHMVAATSKNIIAKLDFSVDLKNSEENIIKIIKKALSSYKKHASSFKNRPYKIAAKKSDIIDFEKASYLSQQSIVSIVTSPEYLYECDVNSGIEFDDRYFLPQKILSYTTTDQIHNFENRVVCGFIQTILEFLLRQQRQVLELEKEVKPNITDDEYFSFSGLMKSKSKDDLLKFKNEITILISEFESIKKSYGKIFVFPVEGLQILPRCSKVFENVAHYREVYQLIRLWFGNNRTTLFNQKINLHLAKTSLLFEHYLLLKQLNHFLDNGWIMISKSVVKYDLEEKTEYINVPYFNVFSFEKGEKKQELFYQPFIGATSYQNGINLYRAVSYPRPGKGHAEDNYYTPDYILKKSGDGDEEIYTIVDAKFSTRDNFLKHQLAKMVFKYVYSIAPTVAHASVNKIVILCGKDEHSARVQLPDMKNPVSDVGYKEGNFIVSTIDPTNEKQANNHGRCLDDLL